MSALPTSSFTMFAKFKPYEYTNSSYNCDSAPVIAFGRRELGSIGIVISTYNGRVGYRWGVDQASPDSGGIHFDPDYNENDHDIDYATIFNNDVAVAVTYDGTKFRMYVKGKQVRCNSSWDHECKLPKINNTIYVFSDDRKHDYNDSGFSGKIYEIALWNRVLTADELTAITYR